MPFSSPNTFNAFDYLCFTIIPTDFIAIKMIVTLNRLAVIGESGESKMNLTSVLITSIFLYSAFRYLDVWSTKICLEKLDPRLHEVNPIAAPLFHKLGFNKTMIIMWIPFAVAIGAADAFVITPLIGIPILWLFFGLFHVLAGINNLQVHARVKQFGAETIEEDTKQLIRKLKSLSKINKIKYLVQMNILNLFFALYGIIALILFFQLLPAIDISFKTPIPALLFLTPIIMIIDFICFFPTMAFGTLLISLRQLSIDIGPVDPIEKSHNLTISVDFLEYLVNEAHEKGANCIQIPYQELKQEGGDK